MLIWRTAREVCELEPDEPDFIIRGLIVKGAISLVTAKIKTGKTTFVGASIRAMLAGQLFIERDTQPAKVLWCTEEGPRTFSTMLRRVGLEDETEIKIAHRGEVPRSMSWLDTVLEIAITAEAEEVGLIIIDTLPRWAKIPPDKENDPGAAALAMEPLEILRDKGFAVMPIFHDRKSGGDVEDATRGSSAFGGAADILVGLSHPRVNGHPNRRTLNVVGRLDMPEEMVIDYAGGTYKLQDNDGLSVEALTAELAIGALLRKGPLTRPQILKAVDAAASTIDRALRRMKDAGRVVVTGRGVRGAPDTYTFCTV